MTLFGFKSSERPAVLSEVSDNGQNSRSQTPLAAMGLFSKKKKDKGSDKKSPNAAGGEVAAGGDENDPLGLATPPPAGHTAPAAAKHDDSPAKAGGGSIDPGSGHRVALHAAQFLTGIAAETRGLFEEVRPVAEVKDVWDVLAQVRTSPVPRSLSCGVDPENIRQAHGFFSCFGGGLHLGQHYTVLNNSFIHTPLISAPSSAPMIPVALPSDSPLPILPANELKPVRREYMVTMLCPVGHK